MISHRRQAYLQAERQSKQHQAPPGVMQSQSLKTSSINVHST